MQQRDHTMYHEAYHKMILRGFAIASTTKRGLICGSPFTKVGFSILTVFVLECCQRLGKSEKSNHSFP
jgi:hypothetical protein